jgi:hypothetical protein
VIRNGEVLGVGNDVRVIMSHEGMQLEWRIMNIGESNVADISIDPSSYSSFDTFTTTFVPNTRFLSLLLGTWRRVDT